MKPEEPLFEIISPSATLNLGPGRVLEVQGARVRLDMAEQPRWAISALAHFYQPCVGDTVLVALDGEACYVVGLIHGTGALRLTAPGDLELRAPRGRIGITARHGVEVRSDTVRLISKRLDIVASVLSERFRDVSRWIGNAMQVRAGRVHMTVRGDYRVKAERIIERAEGDVKIDGNKIHLG